MTTTFTLIVPGPLVSNSDTLIRGYVTSYAAQAGYTNAVVQSVTWANNAYTVTGYVTNAQQFSSGFPLSSAYGNLLNAINPPTLQSSLSAGGVVGIVFGVLLAATLITVPAIYYNRERLAKFINNKPEQVEKKTENPLSINSENQPPQIIQNKQLRMSLPRVEESYYDPESSEQDSGFRMVSNDYIKTLIRQASLANIEGVAVPNRVNFAPINNRKPAYDAIKMASRVGEPPSLTVPPPPPVPSTPLSPFVKQNSASNLPIKPIALPSVVSGFPKSASLKTAVNPFLRPDQQLPPKMPPGPIIKTYKSSRRFTIPPPDDNIPPARPASLSEPLPEERKAFEPIQSQPVVSLDEIVNIVEEPEAKAAEV